jgi:predicted O-linked N-acetylglucosamine transferase (SPINDLY family)
MSRPAPRPKQPAAPDPQAAEAQLRTRLRDQPGNAMVWQQLALLLAQWNRHEEAVEAFARATAAGASAAALATPHALSLSALKRHGEAVAVVAPVQARKPRDTNLANLLGVLLKRAGRLDEALAMLEQARRLDPRSLSPWQNLGNTLELKGDPAGAAAAFAGALRIAPRNAELWRLRGRCLRALGDRAAARTSLEKALALEPGDRDAVILLVPLLAEMGEAEAALAAIERSRAARPGDPAADVLAARLRMQMGQMEEARATLQAAIAAEPANVEANMALARLHGDGDRRAANEALRRAVAANPQSWEAAEALMDSLGRSRHDDEAAHLEEAYRIACRLLREHPDRLARLARGLRTVFQRVLDEDRLAATGPLRALLPHWLAEGRHSAVHYELGQVETLEDRIAIVEWHRAWGRRAAAGISPVALPATPALATGRKLRVGFMSSDLRNHPVSYFALPLIESHDPDRVEVFCYSFYEGERDRVQEIMERKAAGFRWWPRQPDAQVAEGIAQDGLDILFELGGSTAMNRLEVMAHRPARLGASWLAYPHSAGLEQIDYVLVDPYIRPADPRLLIEQPFEMPESWVVLGRLGFTDQPIHDGLPEERNNAITFGTANNPYKYTPACLDAWAAVLRAVPRSRFVFIRPEAAGQSFMDNARIAFARRDVDPTRLDFIGVRGKHLPYYNTVDIALDSLPHVGGTTTCEALWMGVPTISLVGPGFPERLSYSNLSNAGLGEFCAFSVEDYVAKAVALAGDRARRRLLRHGLRDQIRRNPLGQVQRFVENFYGRCAEVAAR